MRRSLAAALLLAAMARGGVPEAYSAARRVVVEHLSELADWCGKNQLYLDRSHVFELILRYDPDHAEARKGLRHVLRDGQWEQPAPYTPPKNASSKMHGEYVTRRAAILKQFADGLAAVLEKESATWTPSARKLAIEDVLAIEPDNEQVRAINGQVRVDDRWVLAETVRGAKRRRELAEAAEGALASIGEPRRVEVGEDARLGVAWTDAVETDTWRVVATTGPDEARKAAAVATATLPLFEACFGIAVKPRTGQVYYMMVQPSDFQAVLTNHPRCTPEFRKFAFDVGCAWLPKTAVLLAHSKQAVTRLEYAARQPTAALLLRGFGVTAKQGWAYEGIGLYLTELLTGTHTTYTVHPSEYARGGRQGTEELWAKIQEPQADWFEVARQLVTEQKNPDLIDLMSKDVNDMDARDLIFAYVLGAYVIEAQAERAPDLLRAIGEKKVAYHDAVPQVLGLDVRALQQRVHEWLAERR